MKRGYLKLLANNCQITQQHLSDILGRRKKPSANLAVKLEEFTSVSRMLWIWGTRKELRESLEKACDSGWFNNWHLEKMPPDKNKDEYTR